MTTVPFPFASAARRPAVPSAAMTDRRRLALLALLILAASATYLVGNGATALWDRDEPRYAQTSRQMLQSGDWVVPHFLDLVRTAKPPMIYWCQAAAMAVFGDGGEAGTFAARLPSAVAVAVLLVGLSAVLWRPLGSQRTLWTVTIFATSGLTLAAAKMCVTDAVLLVWTTAAQLCLYAAWRGRATWPVVVVWGAAVGLAGLTKGPVTIGVQLATLAVLGVMSLLDRRWPPVPAGDAAAGSRVRLTAAKVVVAVLLAAAIFTPWAVLVSRRAKAIPADVGGPTNGTLAPGGSFLWTAFKHEVLDRMVTPLEQHSGPPGYYFASIWGTFFPWSLLLPLAIGVAVHRRADRRTRFALAAVVGPWLMFESFPTKLPHYLLPVFPPLAVLTADALVRCLTGEMADLRGKPFKVAVAVWAVVVAVVASAPWLAVGRYPTLPVGPMVTLSLLGLAFGGTVAALVWRERLAAAAVALPLFTLAAVAIAFGLYLPRADFLRLAPRVAAVLRDHGATAPGDAAMLDYKEPGLAWAQGGTIREARHLWFTPAQAAGLPPWLVMTGDVWDHAPAALRRDWTVVADEYGLSYADRGRWVHALVVHRRATVTDARIVPAAARTAE